jgi:serine/threonine protein kinase
MVYRALHTTLNVPVAVKFLRNRTAGAVDEFLDRFRAEARLLAQLNHPNVVRVLDYEDDPALPYVVMEFVEGLSIQDLLAQTGRIWWERAVTILLQTVDGLEAAGRLGIVHRDVKPGNILVARDGTVKVVDLGLAVRIDPQDATPAAGPPTHMDGTLAYMCPERARNPAGIDIRADIYSLGITFFQMVTGRLPFDGSSVFRVLAAHAGEPMPAAHETAPDVPPAVSEVIRQMTAKQPEDRYQSYEEVRLALLGLRGHPAGAAARASGYPA